VLVRTRSFSCNYRDKAFGYAVRRHAAHRFFVIGSEFAGEVVAVGPGVTGLRPGDRVMPNHAYTGRTGAEGHGGVVSNQSSREFHVVAASRLRRIPDGMPDEVAGGFSLNAQTAYSMVRRAGVARGEAVLVTAARSNTSLFVIAALRARGARVFAATSSVDCAGRLEALGAEAVIPLAGRGTCFRDTGAVDAAAAELGGFACVIDPMFDAHVEKALQVLAPFGRYVTCGLVAQTPDSQRHSGLDGRLDGTRLLEACMVRNLTIIGNCIGLTEDLDDAARDYAAGAFRPPVDSVFGGERAAAFLDRSFNAADRFGKVVFQYQA
jgi:NADPH:quinone reductase-like Zn-dependent oxidoreductase